MADLTKAKITLLQAMAESSDGISVYEAQDLGSGGLGLSNLVKHGLAISTRHANGQLWSISDAGRLALKNQESDRG